MLLFCYAPPLTVMFAHPGVVTIMLYWAYGCSHAGGKPAFSLGSILVERQSLSLFTLALEFGQLLYAMSDCFTLNDYTGLLRSQYDDSAPYYTHVHMAALMEIQETC
jgi:hypothetical protein